MSLFPYQIGLLGDFAAHQSAVERTVRKRFLDLGFQDADFKILLGPDVADRERKSPFAAIFFGYTGADTATHPEVDNILADSVVILPIVPRLKNYTTFVPPQLLHINGVELDSADQDFERDVGTVLENFRLLRQDRRLFISYKRDDSRRIAMQLYEALDRRGFDVFLDTQGVPPGRDFQSVLWHRLADSDVVVLLDTPHFFESRWTEQEVARANATNVQILHVLWPGRPVPAGSALSGFHGLTSNMFSGTELGDSAQLQQSAVDAIAIEVESLRARALFLRHRYLVDAFCDEAKRRGMAADVQPSRHIVLGGKMGPIAVVPIVGVPSAMRLHDVHRELERQPSKNGAIWALYDERGLLEETLSHLDWLNLSLPLIAVRVFDVVSRLDQERTP
jgi:hypothetical protein